MRFKAKRQRGMRFKSKRKTPKDLSKPKTPNKTGKAKILKITPDDYDKKVRSGQIKIIDISKKIVRYKGITYKWRSQTFDEPKNYTLVPLKDWEKDL